MSTAKPKEKISPPEKQWKMHKRSGLKPHLNKTAKLFMNGRSQAVRIPAEYRFEGDEVLIRQDEDTGDLIISKKEPDWDTFFSLLDSMDVSEDFLIDRDNDEIKEKDLF